MSAIICYNHFQMTTRKRLLQIYESVKVNEQSIAVQDENIVFTLKEATYDSCYHLRINGSRYQYDLHHFILLKLLMYYEIQGQKLQYKQLWQHFHTYFEYQRGRPLQIRDLRLQIKPIEAPYHQKGTEPYKALNNFENQKFKIKIDYSMTISYLAFEVLQFIRRQFQKPQTLDLSIRQQIVKLILQKGEQVFFTSAQLQLLSYFDFDFRHLLAKQFKTNLQLENATIYNQKRFKNAYFCASLVFNPTKITSWIFNRQITFNNRILLKGMGGIGKSCSIVLLVQLCRVITDQIYDNKDFNFFVVNKSKYLDTPRYIYISLSDNLDIQDYRKIVQCQIDEKIAGQVKKQSCCHFLSQIIKRYQQKQIQVIFVIDQINIYYSCVRRCIQLQEQIKKEEEKESQKRHKRSSSAEIASKNVNKKQKKKNDQKKNEEIFQSLDKLRQQLARLIKFVNNFYKFHKDLDNQKTTILYSASSNIETYSSDEVKKHNIFLYDNVHIDLKVQQWQLNLNSKEDSQRFIEMIHIIWFEIQMHLRSKKNNSLLKIMRKEMQVIIRRSESADFTEQQLSVPVGLTHLRISKFFKKNSKYIKRFSQNQTPIENITEDIQIMKTNFMKFLDEIIDYCLSEFKEDFKKFLNKGDQHQVFTKFCIFNQIKKYSQENIESIQIIQLDIREIAENLNYKSEFQNLIDIDHGRIQKTAIILNYPPSFFMQIAQQIQRDFNWLNDFFQDMINIYGINNGVFGSIFDNCCTKIITEFDVSLTFNNISLILKSHHSQTFEHFFPGQENVQIQSKLSNVLNELQKSNVQWISASPRLKHPNFRKKCNNYYSQTSRCIDCLLMTRNKQNNSYDIKTLDFAMSFDDSKIKSKKEKAQIFFCQFLTNAKKVSLKFNLEHYIVVRPHTRTSNDVIAFKGQSFTIRVICINDIQFSFLRKQSFDKKTDKYTQPLFKSFMNKFRQQSNEK